MHMNKSIAGAAGAFIAALIAAGTLGGCAVNINGDIPSGSAKAVVEARFAAFKERDVNAIAALYAPNAITTSPGFCADRTGRDAVKTTYSDLFRVYANIQDEVTSMVVDGNHVAVQFIAHARKPDGSALFDVRIANFLTVENGLITRDDTYFDSKGYPCS
jgi:ketosteroid isomerase-like protein